MDSLMSIWVFLIGILFGVLIGVIFSFRTAVTPLQNKISDQNQQQRIYQNYISKERYPYSKEGFRFIGDPVDGIQFENNEIIFVDILSDDKKVNERRKYVKQLVESRKVKYMEILV